MKPDEWKRVLLLHVTGKEIQDLFETLDSTGSTYAEALTALNTYFEPKKNVIFSYDAENMEQQNQ